MVVRAQERGAAEPTGAIGEVTVTLDGSPLAEAALPVAAHLAESLAAPLTLLRVLPRVVSPAYEAAAVAPPLPIEELERAGEAAAQEYLARIAARIRKPSLAVRTVWRQSGDRPPDERITDYLTARPTPIAVMASHGRGGVLRWALGSTVERVLTSAPCPVVIVRAGTVAADEGGGAAMTSVSEG